MLPKKEGAGYIKILLVIDMQNDFINGSLGSSQAEGIVANVREKVQQYRQNNYTVIFTRDTHEANYLNTQEGKKLPVEHCIENTHGWFITNEIDVKSDMVWNKKTFGSLELAKYIRDETNADEIEIIGLCTDICVVSNALILKAFLPEIIIKVDARCCAGVTEESHKAALLTMQMCHIEILS